MRKALGLLVAGAALAVATGLATPVSALRVGSSTVDQISFDRELAALKASPSFQCYLDARAFVPSQLSGPLLGGVSSQTRSSAGAVAWADQRVAALAITPFVQAHDPSAFSAPALQLARGALEDTIVRTLYKAFTTQSATPFSCPAAVAASGRAIKSGATILATLPTWLQDDQVRSEAAALGVIALLPAAIKIPQSGAALKQWYARHQSKFDTTCVSAIELPSLAAASSVESKIAAGLSFASAARHYSRDTTTNKKGGALGCFSPSSSAWSLVVQYVGSTPIGKIALWPVSGAYYLFTPTKRTPNAFAAVATAVATQVQTANVQNAGIFAATIQQASPIVIGSWLGAWGPNQIGGQILANSAPPGAAVVNPSANTPTP